MLAALIPYEPLSLVQRSHHGQLPALLRVLVVGRVVHGPGVWAALEVDVGLRPSSHGSAQRQRLHARHGEVSLHAAGDVQAALVQMSVVKFLAGSINAVEQRTGQTLLAVYMQMV